MWSRQANARVPSSQAARNGTPHQVRSRCRRSRCALPFLGQTTGGPPLKRHPTIPIGRASVSSFFDEDEQYRLVAAFRALPVGQDGAHVTIHRTIVNRPRLITSRPPANSRNSSHLITILR